MSEPSQANSKPLSGIRIVDFTRFFAGPYCAQLLGDLGADVIKVELPVTGDPLRQQGPPFFAGNGITYYATNRNKRSITLDMQTPEGRRLARELCLKADVVLENFRPDVMKKLGLDYEGLASEAPRLIYASISGFGPDGPDASQGAFDLTIQALGGYMSITGERDGAPIKLGTSAFDMLAGMNCQSAIMTALFQRASTGRGQKVTTSLLESEVAFLANAALEYLITGVEPQKWGSEHAQQVPYKAFRTSDGWAIIGAGFQNFFEAFVRIVGRPELAQDERFKSMSGRVSHREALYGILDAEVLKFTTAEIIGRLEEARVPCAPVNNMEQVFRHRQVQHRGLRMDLEHPDYGGVPTLGPAARYSGFNVTEGWTAPPLLGQHSGEILRDWLDMPQEDIARLQETRIT
jgi:succinate---hydroxymethylglutarate CoA-transferase